MSTAPRQMQSLTEEESLALLGGVTLGRIVFTRHALPAIRPVNHIIDDGKIIIRSHMGAAVVHHANTAGGVVVAYEADELDPVQHLGWSVVVTGTARLVRDPDAAARYQRSLRPWVAREMDQVISISPDIVTGIRLVDAADAR